MISIYAIWEEAYWFFLMCIKKKFEFENHAKKGSIVIPNVFKCTSWDAITFKIKQFLALVVLIKQTP